MLLKNYQTLFVIFLITGTVIAVSSNSWFIAWIGLELNLISIIPLFTYKINSMAIESCIKYFLPQALASAIIITYAAIDYILSSYIISSFTLILLTIGLLIKLGLPPFYFWFPQIINKLNWKLCILIISWQKLAPFMLISSVLTSNILTIMVAASAGIGALGGFNQNLTKLIITYSSISHGAWILPLVRFSLHNWWIYFLIYCLISLSLIYLLSLNNVLLISNLSHKQLSTKHKLIFSLTLMSLGGLPPLLGFIAKLNAILLILNFSRISMLLVLISSSLVSLFYYIKITYNIITIQPFKMLKTTKPLYASFSLNSTIFIILVGNIVTPLLVSLT